jgi:hypothetical protein
MRIPLKLPPVEKIRLKAGWPYGYSDQYGAFHIAANYCNLRRPPNLPGFWQHGVKGPWEQISAGNIVNHYPNYGQLHSFLAREDEKVYLEEKGVPLCEAIGLPFVYAENPEKNERIPVSLLVMPQHSVAGVKAVRKKAQLKAYSELVATYKREFSNVTVCLHFGDLVNNYWRDLFEELNIKWVLGGHPLDRNSLPRVKALLSRFEYVTSNSWGSHIAYGLSLGAKVSIWGEPNETDLDVLERDRGQGGRATLEAKRSVEFQNRKDLFLRGLYRPPWRGVINTDLGNFLVGQASKKDPEQLKELFGW